MIKVKLLSIGLIGFLLLLIACKDSNEPSQLENDVAIIDDYLMTNNIDALKDVNGIRFTSDSLGSGFTPRISDKITADYTGKLLSGTVFETGTLPDFLITNLITGLQIGLPQIPNGGKATIYIPSVYAYGSQSSNKIPANSNLIFHIKLKSITVTTEEKNQRKADTLALDNFLNTAGITAVKDTSGLRYTIDQPGSGTPPSWFNKVKIKYSGYLIATNAKGDKFYEGTAEPNESTDSRVVNYIRGFQAGLQKMQKGSKATLYIPSVLGFGNKAVSGGLVPVPANSNLIYEIELIDVLNP